MGHLNEEKTMNTQEHPATAQQSADAAFSAAWEAARKNGGRGSFMCVTDEAGAHRVIERHAPAEYAEYQRVLRAAQAAMRGTKYEGAITS